MKKSELRNIIKESIKELMTEQQFSTTINGGNCDGNIILPGSNYNHMDLAQEIIDIYGPTADFRNYAGKSNLEFSVCDDFPPGTVCCVDPYTTDKIWIHSPTWKDYTTNTTYHTFQDIINFLNSNGYNVNINDSLDDVMQQTHPVLQFSFIGYCNDCDGGDYCLPPQGGCPPLQTPSGPIAQIWQGFPHCKCLSPSISFPNTGTFSVDPILTPYRPVGSGDDPCDKFYTMTQLQQDQCCERCLNPNLSPQSSCYPYCDCCKNK